MSLFKRQQNNTKAVTQLLIKDLNAKVTKTSIKKCLGDHPDFPSLMAIEDCLTEWRLASETTRINKDKYNASSYDFPFIAHFNEHGGQFILVHGIAKGIVTYSDEKHYKTTITEAEFLKKWDGIQLYAEADEESIETNYKDNRLNEIIKAIKIPLLILIIIGTILSTIHYQSLTLGYALILLLKLAGVGLGVLLLAHSIDANNPLVQNLCSLGNKNNCNAILKSDAARVTNWLSWSEVGFFYFTGTFLCLLLNPFITNLVACFSLLALPYTIYSITYQYRHKNWCVLCCAVQMLLVLENLTALGFGFWSFGFEGLMSLSFIIRSLICIFFPIIVWSLLKPLLLKYIQFNPLKQQLNKFKYNSALFNQALTNQPRYAINDDLMPVVLGNPKAETVITMVSNPFCGPCGKAHETLDEWLKTRDDLQLKIIFTTSDHDDDEKTKVSRHIGALTALKNTDLLEKALNDWYAQGAKKYESWAQKYPITFNGEMNKVTEKQKTWCDMAEITFTPTILVNGYKLPEPYRLEDIKYLIA